MHTCQNVYSDLRIVKMLYVVKFILVLKFCFLVLTSSPGSVVVWTRSERQAAVQMNVQLKCQQANHCHYRQSLRKACMCFIVNLS